MEYLGELFKTTREKKKLSLEDVQKSTKIPKEILHNIEMDKISTINTTYLKGYLKIYSRFLGLDTAQAFEAYKLALPKEQKPLPKDSVSSAPFKPVLLLNILIALALVLSAVIFIKYITHKKKTSPFSPPIVSSASSAKTKSAPRSKVKRPAPAIVERKTQPAVAQSDNVRLAIYARETTNLQVSVDGNLMFRGQLRKGQAENWTAKEKISLSIGNPNNVNLEINGKRYPTLGKRPIKNMVVKRDGSIQTR